MRRINRFLYVGNIESALDVNAITAHRIGGVVNVGYSTPIISRADPHDLVRVWVPLRDGDYNPISAYVAACYAVDSLIRSTNKPVLVHCVAGQSRSVFICALYITWKTGGDFSDILESVANSHESLVRKEHKEKVDEILRCLKTM